MTPNTFLPALTFYITVKHCLDLGKFLNFQSPICHMEIRIYFDLSRYHELYRFIICESVIITEKDSQA